MKGACINGGIKYSRKNRGEQSDRLVSGIANMEIEFLEFLEAFN